MGFPPDRGFECNVTANNLLGIETDKGNLLVPSRSPSCVEFADLFGRPLCLHWLLQSLQLRCQRAGLVWVMTFQFVLVGKPLLSIGCKRRDNKRHSTLGPFLYRS
jgi:hypothetical protein